MINLSLDNPLRREASHLIHDVYRDQYNAKGIRLPKTILALIDSAEKVHCAAGLRDYSETYFSEYYLDAPIDRLIRSISGRPVERREIVEVSSLASRSPRFVGQFVHDLISYGEQQGYNWAFFTATSRLEKLLRKSGLKLIDLGVASSDRIPSSGDWGSYYLTSPRVFAIGRTQVTAYLEKSIHSHPPFSSSRPSAARHGMMA